MKKSTPSSAVDTLLLYQFKTMENNTKITAYIIRIFLPLMYGLLPQLKKSEIVMDMSLLDWNL